MWYHWQLHSGLFHLQALVYIIWNSLLLWVMSCIFLNCKIKHHHAWKRLSREVIQKWGGSKIDQVQHHGPGIWMANMSSFGPHEVCHLPKRASSWQSRGKWPLWENAGCHHAPRYKTEAVACGQGTSRGAKWFYPWSWHLHPEIAEPRLCAAFRLTEACKYLHKTKSLLCYDMGPLTEVDFLIDISEDML